MNIKVISAFLFLVFFLLFISWKYLRYSFKRRLIEPLSLNDKLIYFYDFMFVFIVFFRSVYRFQWDQFSHIAWVKIFYIDLFLFGWLGFISIFLFTWDFFDIVMKKLQKQDIDKEFNISRRSFLKKNIPLFSVGAMSVGTSVAAAIECSEGNIKAVNIEHSKLPKEFEGLKIAHITDLHIGSTIKAPYLDDIVTKINKHNPDIVALTGDMVDGTVSFLKEELQGLRKLNPKYGVYFVSGNHEYYWGINSWLQFYKDNNITVLNNENKVITIDNKKLLIGGVSDLRAERFVKEHKSDPFKAIGKNSDQVDFRILLAHRPRSADKASLAGFDFQMSGHTHGGQSFPYNIIVSFIQKYLLGEYTVGKMKLYVAAGAGYWGPPVRLGVPTEIPIYTLKRA